VSNRIFWPVMATFSLVLTARYHSRLLRLTWPPHVICLLAYVALAGASVLWAFQPATSFTRYMQQLMVLTSIVLPAMLAVRTELMRGMFLCFALGALLNILVVALGTPNLHENGYPGYFLSKNYLGEFAAPALLLALYEALYPGFRRALGIVAAIISGSLLFLSNSKTGLGLAFICPLLAGLILTIRKITRISLAVILLSIPFCYIIFSNVSNFNMNRISYMLYGDSTFTGRTLIWEFVQHEIERRPLLGWGYQSFWLVPNSPSAEASGWVKMMPEGHNGYYDTKLELGYVGFALLSIFIISTLHAIGRVADRDPRRASLVLSLALLVIIYNFLESLWMRGFEILWVVFLFLVTEIARHWQPLPLTKAAYRRNSPGAGSSGFPRGARVPRPSIRLS
jgi:exopolysaccharide production protein ExoQ